VCRRYGDKKASMRNLSGGNLSHTSPKRRFPYHALILVILILLAFFLRTHQLATIPPAFDYDEAAHAIDAVEILQGHHALYSPKTEGNTTFLKYLFAIAFSLFGTRTFSQRLLIAFVSTLTIPLTYALGSALFYKLGAQRARFVGILAAAGLATSFWHMNYSRIGLEINMVPFIAVLCFYFLWRGTVSARWGLFIVSGWWLGLALYVYPGARFMPVFVILFFIYRWVVTPREPDVTRAEHAWRMFTPLLLVGMSALVIYLPMIVYFAVHPEGFVGRAEGTLFLNPRVNLGDPWGALWRGFVGNIGAFGFTSDMHSQANLPGKSILNPVLAVLFWTGLLLSLLRFKILPYAFCVLWWMVMIFPVIITPDRVPQYGRMMSLAPVTYIFIAITLEQLHAFISDKARWKVTKAIFLIACVVLFSVAAFSTYYDYFSRWAPGGKTFLAFSGPAQELAEIINSDNSPNSVYVLPCDAQGETECDYSYQCNHFPLSFFHRIGGTGAPLQYVFMYEPSIPDRLTEITQGKDQVHLIALKRGKRKFRYPEADPRNLLQFFLEGAGHLENMESSPNYDILSYRLATDRTVFTLPDQFQGLDIGFGEQLLLREGAFGGVSTGELGPLSEIPSGGEAWVVLNWDVLAPVPENYRASLRLFDQAGHVVSQVDHVLLGPRRQGTSRWTEADSPISDYYLFPIPSTAPPGTYDLQIGLYSPASKHLLPLDGKPGQNLASLGTLKIVAPEVPFPGQEIDVAHELDVVVTPEITMLGHDVDLSQSYFPGENGSLLLYWQVNGSLEEDLLWHLDLEARGKRWPLVEPVFPLGPGFPTSSWSSGQVWKGIYDFVLPSQVPAGNYDLVGHFTAEDGVSRGESVSFGSIEVTGRARSFEVPEIAYPLDVNFDGKMQLLGYEMDAIELERGSELRLVLHWQALAPMDTSYTMFVHLLDAKGQVRSQRDAIPGEGTLPTTGWLPGEVISARITIPLDESLPAGQYTMEVGAYDPLNSQRLPAHDGKSQPLGDHLILQSVDVK
jgi:4-amino-4-deoxy-L-arabinose transferase-like glycosyltransferase